MVLWHIYEIEDVADPTGVMKWNKEELRPDLLCSVIAAVIFYNVLVVRFQDFVLLCFEFHSFASKFKLGLDFSNLIIFFTSFKIFSFLVLKLLIYKIIYLLL